MGLFDRDYQSGGGHSGGGFSFFPPVLKYILIINGAVFFIQILLQGTYLGNLIRYFGALQPVLVDSSSFFPTQLITYQFMHANFGHIFFNMLILWMFGVEIENIWGSKKFLIFYLACGIGAGLAQLFIAPVIEGVAAPTVGASGSVYGVMAAFALFFPNRYIFFYFLIPIQAKYLIPGLIILEWFLVSSSSGVAHLAHIGGAVTGLIFVLSDRRYVYNFFKLWESLKRNFNSPSNKGNFSSKSRGSFRKNPYDDQDVEEAKFYDIESKKQSKDEIDQEEIDRILDKISQSGYQKLTEREKRILFEASKKGN